LSLGSEVEPQETGTPDLKVPPNPVLKPKPDNRYKDYNVCIVRTLQATFKQITAKMVMSF